MTAKDENAVSDAMQRRELLRQLLLQKASRSEKIAASCAQRRLWFINRIEAPNPSYNIPCHITLRGPVDRQALESAANLLISRHDILRTSFQNENGEPYQVISPECKIPLRYADLTGLEQSGRLQRVADSLESEATHIFDLETIPLIRLKLIKCFTAGETATGKDEHALLIVMHHIISDGWSIAVLARDLFGIYDHLVRSRPLPAPLKLQYADYSKRQARWLNTDQYRYQLSFWEKRLADLPTLELPKDAPRTQDRSFRGGNLFTRIDTSLVKQLKTLCDRQAVTLNMLLASAFSLLLHRYTDQADIVFGSPVANRNQEDIEGLIGLFVNMLVVRGRISPAESFSAHLARIREYLVGAYANQEAPFENIVEALQPERDLGVNPMFQVVFAMQNEAMPAIDLGELAIESPVVPGYDDSQYGVGANATRFDLELHCWDSEEDLRCSWIYNTSLFTRASIERMAGHFKQLLEQINARPDAPVSSLVILGPEESNSLVNRFAGITSAYPRNQTVTDLFGEQVRATPDAVALVYRDRRLTYSQLNSRANQLAHYLRECGVVPETMVGVSMEKCPDMVVSLLAILKAGGAYVPLDPEYPPSRLTFMVEDTAAPVLITHSSVSARLPGYTGKVICIDREWPEISQRPDTSPAAGTTAASLMYVMYTSGSTGRPKGVSIEHRGAVRLVKNTNYVAISPADVFLQFAPVAFDASTFEIWGALLNGAQLVIYPEQKASLDRLANTIEQHAVTTLWLTSALFNQMVDSHLASLRQVRSLLAGGEALSVHHVNRYLDFISAMDTPDHVLINGYGPTENTTFTCCHVMGSGSRVEYTVPIGVPVSNTDVYLLDQYMQPVPEGVTGELYIGGDGLSRGYHNRGDLTAQKFISHAVDDKRAQRLYRTGDLVRQRNGVIEFVGRIDGQVKLRGYRIELGEIQSVLKQFPAVADAHVVLGANESGEMRLVAYVVADGSKEGIIPELKHYLSDYLPGYMIPSAFVELDSLPLTANGKIDQESLPKPSMARQLRDDYVAPGNELEKSIADSWCQVLGLNKAGVNDNFFDLGGDSFGLMKAHALLEQILGRQVPVTDLFRYPTIRGLADHYGAGHKDSSLLQDGIIQRSDRQRTAIGRSKRIPGRASKS
jgi:aspartate racemase